MPSRRERVPTCGEDLCEECGDCIACYGDEFSCYDSLPHVWPPTLANEGGN